MTQMLCGGLRACFLRFCLIAGVACGAQAQSLTEIGVNLLRATTTNTDGSGIIVGQPEASLSGSSDVFEVTPSYVAWPANRMVWYSGLGFATNSPNSLGSDSWHADQVASDFYGQPNGLATNVALVDNEDADYFITNFVFNLTPLPLPENVINQSFTFGNVNTNQPPPTNSLSIADQEQIDSVYDDYANVYGNLFISAANNVGTVSPPATAYDSLGVGCCGPGANSSIGPTPDNGRCKPDLTAPAVDTSFSAPQVAGAAAILLQAGARGDGGPDTNAATDMRTLRALLLNGTVKPADWTNTPPAPLDYRYGAGVLNIFNSYRLLAAGEQTNVVSTLASLGGSHPPSAATNRLGSLNGWNFHTLTTSATNDAVDHYLFTLTNGAGPWSATVTLEWNRQYGETNINQLALFLYNTANSNLVACSTSLVDNVQHFWVRRLPPGTYDVEVWMAGGTNTVSVQEDYALAFALNPLPTVQARRLGTAVTLNWPLYPAGYGLQIATNLTGAAWTTNSIPLPTLTNGQNQISWPVTNSAVFFRLASPNF